MTRLWLGIRRLWWFFTDWKTNMVFNFQCPHCDDEMVFEGQGWFNFRPLQHANPLCRYRAFFRLWEDDDLSWRCSHCWVTRVGMLRFWMEQRWAFRLKWNWGIGLPPACKAGDHQWTKDDDGYAMPEAIYAIDDLVYMNMRCRACDFTQRFILTEDQAEQWRLANRPNVPKEYRHGR